MHSRNLVWDLKLLSTKYRAREPNAVYFVTLTITDWIDVFTRLRQKHLLVNSLAYCQKGKGLEIYAYCLMTNHLHLLCKAKEGYKLSDIIRDFKKFTSKKIVKNIREYPESRREWMLNAFKKACQSLKRNQQYKVWQDGYHAEIAYSNRFINQKMNYIHNNPVVAGIVAYPEDYLFTSARNYACLGYELEVVMVFIE